MDGDWSDVEPYYYENMFEAELLEAAAMHAKADGMDVEVAQ